MGSREVPLVYGKCDGCKKETEVYDFYGDYICPECEQRAHKDAQLIEARKLIRELANYIDRSARCDLCYPDGSYWEANLAPRVDEFLNQWGTD